MLAISVVTNRLIEYFSKTISPVKHLVHNLSRILGSNQYCERQHNACIRVQL